MRVSMTNQTSENSIFDFIYLDLPKIRSYMAQMRGGINVEYTKLSGNTSNNAYSLSLAINGNGGVDVPYLASASSGVESTGGWTNDSSDTLSRSTTKNLEDMLPRDMINTLIEQNLVHKSLASGNLGKLVLIKGNILFVDFKQLTQGAKPSVEFYYEHFATSKEKKDTKKTLSMVKDIDEIFRNYPIRLQAYMLNETQVGVHHVWMALEEDYVINNHLDSTFKYDVCSEESFYVLGVFDALSSDKIDENSHKKMDRFKKNLESFNEVNSFLFALSDAYRAMAGRPKNCYGITPVAIFRQLE